MSYSAIGYYITPALLGSPNDQMVSYFVAFYTNTSINWGMAVPWQPVRWACCWATRVRENMVARRCPLAARAGGEGWRLSGARG